MNLDPVTENLNLLPYFNGLYCVKFSRFPTRVAGTSRLRSVGTSPGRSAGQSRTKGAGTSLDNTVVMSIKRYRHTVKILHFWELFPLVLLDYFCLKVETLLCKLLIVYKPCWIGSFRSSACTYALDRITIILKYKAQQSPTKSGWGSISIFVVRSFRNE